MPDTLVEWLGPTLISVIVALLLHRATAKRSRRSLKVTVIGARELARKHRDLGHLVTISINGTVVENARFVVIWVRNNGGKEIRTEDIEQPLTINFGPNASISLCGISEKDPDNLNVDCRSSGSSLELQQLGTFNPGESVKLWAIIGNAGGEIKAQARIAGVTLKDLDRYDTRRYRRQVVEDMLILIFASMTLSVLVPAAILGPTLSKAQMVTGFLSTAAVLYTSVRFVRRAWLCKDVIESGPAAAPYPVPPNPNPGRS